MTVRVRGIYATALTELFHDDPGVVQASEPMRERFAHEFPVERADAVVSTTDDRQGVCVVGRPESVERIVDELGTLSRDTLSWVDPTPRGTVFTGEVLDTLGNGAVVDIGESEGFLPYANVSGRVEAGDRLHVQVSEPIPPWGTDRPVLDTTVEVRGSLATLIRGGTADSNGPALADILLTEPREGWGVRWDESSDGAGLDALGAALDGLNERAAAIEDALDTAPDPDEVPPQGESTDESTAWVWFGRETRFALDEVRRAVTTTMPGHHRTKAGANSASAAVDLVEALLDDGGVETGDQDFPFAAVARQFGPQAGMTVDIAHGKPDGRLITLGQADIDSVDSDGTVTLRREMSPGGTYDALDVDRQTGDVAITKVKEGRWWYPTMYEGSDGERRGTYVNICTPVEVFPGQVRYVDLHIDVIKHADGAVERVDDDELDDAVTAGRISGELAEKARTVASSLVHGLQDRN